MTGGMTWKVAPLAALAALAVTAQPAQASGAAAVAFPMVVPISTIALQTACTEPATQTAGITQAPAFQSKASAILGGAESALERMRRQQAGAIVSAPATLAAPQVSVNCLEKPSLATPALAPAKPAFRTDEFLSTRLLGIGSTPFDAQWRRVSNAGLSRDRAERLVGAMGTDRETKLHEVNAWVNRTVSYRDDRSAYGRADHWQSAAETLRRGTGDCEDLAIAKYQLLRGLGFPEEDLYVTLARDLARNVDHAVLIVRLGDRHLMLDDATDILIDASGANDYRPMLSFGANRTYMHGIPTRS